MARAYRVAAYADYDYVTPIPVITLLTLRYAPGAQITRNATTLIAPPDGQAWLTKCCSFHIMVTTLNACIRALGCGFAGVPPD